MAVKFDPPEEPTEAMVAVLHRQRDLIHALRATLGCPPGESLLWHAERIMGELEAIREAKRVKVAKPAQQKLQTPKPAGGWSKLKLGDCVRVVGTGTRWDGGQGVVTHVPTTVSDVVVVSLGPEIHQSFFRYQLERDDGRP